MKLKNVPEGNYTKISAIYISLIDGTGCTCDNCGRLIANIVTVKNEETKKYYTIGQDCAKNLFSQEENKAIDKEIKNYISSEKRRIEAEKQAKWNIAYNELRSLTTEITNENINSQWAKDLYNEKLLLMEAKHSIHISYKR